MDAGKVDGWRAALPAIREGLAITTAQNRRIVKPDQ